MSEFCEICPRGRLRLGGSAGHDSPLVQDAEFIREYARRAYIVRHHRRRHMPLLLQLLRQGLKARSIRRELRHK